MKPCGKCGSVERYSNGCCRPCAIAKSRAKAISVEEKELRLAARKQATKERPCKKCGGVSKYKDGECRVCAKLRSKAYAEQIKRTDPTKYKEQNRERSRRNYVAKKEKNFSSQIQKLYGLTFDQWNQMFESQGGSCAICKRHQDNFKYRLAVDHCHNTGKVRALLCPKCNNAVAAYENHKESIEHYLEAFK